MPNPVTVEAEPRAAVPTTAVAWEGKTPEEPFLPAVPTLHASRPRLFLTGLFGPIWVGGSMGLAGIILLKWLAYRRALMRGVVLADATIVSLATSLASRLGLRRDFSIVVTSQPIGPAVFGLWRPVLVLPAALVAGKTPHEIEPVLAHELIHLRRGDPLGGALQVAAEMLWWFHPLVWWANCQACRQRERCCDEEVVAALGCKPGLYARCLLDLVSEQLLRGRVVDSKGQPAANAKVIVLGQFPTEQDSRIPGWPTPAITDAQGRFALHGVNTDQGQLALDGMCTKGGTRVSVVDPRFARWDFHIGRPGTGMTAAEIRKKHPYLGISGDFVAQKDPTEEVTLAPPPAQIIEGRVVYEDTKRPAAHARLTAFAGQYEVAGSWIDVAGQADAEGRFQLNPHPGKYFRVSAYPPDGQPYLARDLRIAWPEGAVSQNVEIAVPRGVLVRGKLSEPPSGQPVDGAGIQYLAASTNRNVPKDIVTGWQAAAVSGPDGTFEIAVPPGRGTLLIRGPTPDYVNKTVSSREIYEGQPGGRRFYVHAMVPLDLRPGDAAYEVKVSLQRGVTVRGRLLGPDDKPPAEAIMASQVSIRSDYPHWSPFPIVVRDGQFELHGVDAEKPVRAYFLDVKNERGAAVEIAAKTAGEGPVTVRLLPCGRATARFLDPQGKPMTDWSPGLHIVMTPGPSSHIYSKKARTELAADEDFVSNFDRQHHWDAKTDREGKVVLPALIPGALYRLITLDKDLGWVTKDLSVKPGETFEVGDIVIDQTRGLVND